MKKELEIAKLAAKEAGKIVLESFNKPLEIKTKQNFRDLVTQVDIASEEKIISILKENFPDHSILSEEAGLSGKGEMQWLVDPLDGTTNYTIHNPFFNVAIALAKGNNIILGVVYAPVTDEIFYATKDHGAFLNDKKIKVSDNAEMQKSFLGTCHAHDLREVKKFMSIYDKIAAKSKNFRLLGSAELELAYVAAARIEAFIGFGIKSWDAAAGSIIVKEAGGKVTDFQGEEWNVSKNDILATNGRIHNEILDIVRS